MVRHLATTLVEGTERAAKRVIIHAQHGAGMEAVIAPKLSCTMRTDVILKRLMRCLKIVRQ